MNHVTALARCNVCGGEEFGHGPSKRLSANGRLPRCMGCDSLERHRIARRIFARLEPFVEGRRFLQFSPDPTVDARWFKELTISVWQGQNSLDMQAIALPGARYDWIYSSHVLNHVPDQAAALREMLRVVGQGVVALSVGGTVFNYETRPSDRNFGPDHQFILYGTEFAGEIQKALPGVAVLELVAADPCTASIDSLYFYSLSEALLRQMARRAVGDNIHARVSAAQETTGPLVSYEAVEPDDDEPRAACNICGATSFALGPRERRSSPHRRLPRCTRCLSLERHRIRRRIFDAIAPLHTAGKRLLMFESEPGLREEWFDEVRVSVSGSSDAIDINWTGLAEGEYPWICASHVLSAYAEDRQALREMLRVAGRSGVVALTLKGTAAEYEAVTRLHDESDLSVARRHATDFASDVTSQLPGTHLLELVTTDPCTESVDSMFLCSRDAKLLEELRSAAIRRGIFARLMVTSSVAPPSLLASEDDWAALGQELEAWRKAGHRARFWIRDDDADSYSDALARLIELCAEEEVPLALAVIPKRTTPSLIAGVTPLTGITVLQHGVDHTNRDTGELRSEFPEHRPLAEALAATELGSRKLAQEFGRHALPVFVPPWGTCSTSLRRALPQAGIVGFSGSQVGPFQPEHLWRRGSAVSREGLRLATAHISVNRNKKGDTSEPRTRRHVKFLTKLVRTIRTEGHDQDEPIGIMTHAWGVDNAVRGFLRQLFHVTRDAGAEWASAREIFGA